MLIDISLKMDLHDPSFVAGADTGLVQLMKDGHLGTHIDICHQEFDLSDCIRCGRILDATHVKDGEIEPSDLFGIEKVQKNEFVIIHTGWSDVQKYGTDIYFNEHPEISMDLLSYFIAKGVALIGIDGPGLKRGALHGKVDQYLADHGILVVENLWGLSNVEGELFQVYCFPMNLENTTGLPCRVLVETMPMSV